MAHSSEPGVSDLNANVETRDGEAGGEMQTTSASCNAEQPNHAAAPTSSSSAGAIPDPVNQIQGEAHDGYTSREGARDPFEWDEFVVLDRCAASGSQPDSDPTTIRLDAYPGERSIVMFVNIHAGLQTGQTIPFPQLDLAANKFNHPTTLNIIPFPDFRITTDAKRTFNPLFFFSNTIRLVSRWELSEETHVTVYVGNTIMNNDVAYLRAIAKEIEQRCWTYECDIGGPLWNLISQVPDIELVTVVHTARVLARGVRSMAIVYHFDTDARVRVMKPLAPR